MHDINAMMKHFEGMINLDKLIPSCIAVAQKIESLGGYTGAEKLALLQKVLRFAIEQSGKTPEEKARFNEMVDVEVPIIVHTAVLASKNPIVGQVQAACIGCWTKK